MWVFLLLGFILPSISVLAEIRQLPSTAPTIEYFGAERGAAVGTEDVIMLAIVRNRTNSLIPSGHYRLRCYAVNGLDYTSGETMPVLPSLAVNQAAAYRWRLSISEGRQTLMAAALLQRVIKTTVSTEPSGKGPNAGNAVNRGETDSISAQNAGSIQSAITVVPRVSRMPSDAAIGIKAGDAPNAIAGTNLATISNDLVCLRMIRSDRKQPVFSLSVRKGAEWSALATGTSLGSVLSAEEGQNPWWESFRWNLARATNEKDLASLILSGTYGNRWRAEITFDARRNSSAINVHIKMSPLRALRCKGFKLPEMLVDRDSRTGAALRADGSPILMDNELSSLPESKQLSAVRKDSVTFGITWSAISSLNGLEWSPALEQDPQIITILGGSALTSTAGSLILPGAIIEINYRIFAYAPSLTIKDAYKFIQP